MTVRLKEWMPAGELPRGNAAATAPADRPLGRGNVQAMTGNGAVALAFRQVDPHLTSAYPITPQTELMHYFAEYIARGEVRTQLVTAECEHSAMSVVLGAAAAGCRTFTATSANGLAHMLEVYHNAGALRLPIVLALVNRHVGGLLNIHNDHSDAMLARNAAWIQLHAENAQEAYDNAIQSFRIGEDERVRLPVTICHDGFIVSHTLERLLTLSDDEVRRFVGEFVPMVDMLDTAHPHGLGPLVMPDFAASLYAQIAETMRWVPEIIEEIGEEYGQITGRRYGLIEGYRMDDAEVAVVAMGSVCGTVRAMIDLLRGAGVRAGLLKIRVFRPFPAAAIGRMLVESESLKAAGVIDKAVELGSGGPLFAETTTAAAMWAQSHARRLPVLVNAIAGVGGRDITLAEVNGIFQHLLAYRDQAAPAHDAVFFVDVGDQGEKVLTLNAEPAAASAPPAKPYCNIVILGRGGQGARTVAYLLAQTAIEKGRFAQASPYYGPERTGAPVKMFAKIGDAPIDDRQQVYAPDALVIFDEYLLETHVKELSLLSPDGVLLVNSQRSPAELRTTFGITCRRVCTIDATGISLAEVGANRPNAVMAAAVNHLLQIGELDDLKAAFQRKMARLGERILQGSLRAMDRAGAEIVVE